MTEVAIERSSTDEQIVGHAYARRAVGLALVWTIVLGNAAAIFWLWAHGGNLSNTTTGETLTSVARITGLLSAYMALIQVVLLARLSVLERLVGFDRLTVWHRWNGHATIDLVVAHVFFSVWGYALMDRYSVGKEISTMIWGGIYPGMIVATIGTALLLGVVATSYVIVRRRLRYEWWYAVHLLAYAGIALAWFHQIPTGNELVLDTAAADYWRALYLATLALLVGFRVVAPIVNAFRFRIRVADVVPEGPGVVSIRMTGRRLDRLHARAGQFFVWRFLTPGHWGAGHPFSLSEAPRGDSLRITVKALGDHTARLGSIAIGTRVLAEGPFGIFTDAFGRRGKRVLIAGGIGITPVRALVEHARGDDVVIYRAMDDDDLVLRDEIEDLGVDAHYVVGDHAAAGGDRLLSPEHLLELVPDLVDRDVYVCGPPGMIDAATKSVRGAGVRRNHIHVERFAL